jgi:hypothetical protein
MSWISDVRSKLGKLDQSRPALVRFGRVMGIALLVIGALIFFFGSHPQRGYWVAGAGVIFLILSWWAPEILRPAQKVWMTFAFALGWIMSRLILTVFFFAIFTPTGLLMRLFGWDPLQLRTKSESYWIPRTGGPRKPEDYERLF